MFHKEGALVRFVSWLITRPWFENILLLAIITNTVLLALEHHNMNAQLKNVLGRVELVFTIGFTVEMMLKIIGLKSLYNYCIKPGTSWNRFDAIVVIATLVDAAVASQAGPDGSGGPNLSLLRVFRVMRILRVLRRNKDLVRLLEAVMASMAGLMNLLAFMVIVIIVFAILGMQLFSGRFKGARSNFDYFGDAMLTLFKMLAGGGTWGIFFNALNSDASWAATPFFVAYNTFSVYITLNFLVVIILGKFALSDEEKQRKREERREAMLAKYRRDAVATELQSVASSFTTQRTTPSRASSLGSLRTHVASPMSASGSPLARLKDDARSTSLSSGLDRVRDISATAAAAAAAADQAAGAGGAGSAGSKLRQQAPTSSLDLLRSQAAESPAPHLLANPVQAMDTPSPSQALQKGLSPGSGNVPTSPGFGGKAGVSNRSIHSDREETGSIAALGTGNCRDRLRGWWDSLFRTGMLGRASRRIRQDKALLVFGPTNRVRVRFKQLVDNPWFERFIIACIVISSINLTFESPRTQLPDWAVTVLQVSDLIFFAIFLIE